jgi:hypothetical protein
MGVAIVAGSNVLVERVAFDGIAIHVFDIEPNNARGGATNITIRDNSVGTYGTCQCFGGSFFRGTGDLAAPVRNVVVSDNVVTGGSLTTVFAWSIAYSGYPYRDISFLRNRSTVTARGPVLSFRHVDGLTVTGNVQPLSSGSLIATQECLNVTAQ